jgi:hypothetical protein
MSAKMHCRIERVVAAVLDWLPISKVKLSTFHCWRRSSYVSVAIHRQVKAGPIARLFLKQTLNFIKCLLCAY